MRVLVATLIYQLYGRMLNGAFQQDWAGPTDYLFLKNDQPQDLAPYARVTYLYRQVQERFLAGPYDALLCVEADMIIPPNALTRLIATDADVAYGLYVWRSAPSYWSAYTSLDDEVGKSIIHADPELARRALRERLVLPIAGVGLGCTLIRRHVLEDISFCLRGMACNDWYFADDCNKAGYKQVCDFGVVCGHVTNTPVLKILWPDTGPQNYREEIIDSRVLRDMEVWHGLSLA